jgi:hypothetical protein
MELIIFFAVLVGSIVHPCAGASTAMTALTTLNESGDSAGMDFTSAYQSIL